VYLSPVEWWNQPPTYPVHQPSGKWDPFYISADGGGLFSPKFEMDAKILDGVVHSLRYDLLVIPPRAAMRFNVDVIFDCEVDDGSIEIDFASTPNYANSIGCQLQLELLTAPYSPEMTG
jgi:hypothetical protein